MDLGIAPRARAKLISESARQTDADRAQQRSSHLPPHSPRQTRARDARDMARDMARDIPSSPASPRAVGEEGIQAEVPPVWSVSPVKHKVGESCGM